VLQRGRNDLVQKLLAKIESQRDGDGRPAAEPTSAASAFNINAPPGWGSADSGCHSALGASRKIQRAIEEISNQRGAAKDVPEGLVLRPAFAAGIALYLQIAALGRGAARIRETIPTEVPIVSGIVPACPFRSVSE
jgi:hypothetical protein